MRGLAAAGRACLDEAALVRWGRAVGAAARPPLWISLFGELGAGKSVFARSVCEGAGVAGVIPSPTFTLLNVYGTPRGWRIVHADLYRIERPQELDGLGWEDLMREHPVVLVEWAERACGRLPADRWDVTLEHVDDPRLRRIRAERVGAPHALPPPPPLGPLPPPNAA